MTHCDPFRYLKHIDLSEIGLEGQKKLLESRVLLIGAGGLGAPIGIYLAAAGVGHITVIDDDVVELSNLQRQILYNTDEVGRPKAELAAERMQRLNPDCRVDTILARFDADNADELTETHDVIIDGSDNFATRYLANATCFKHKKTACIRRHSAIRWPIIDLQGMASGTALLSMPVSYPAYSA